MSGGRRLVGRRGAARRGRPTTSSASRCTSGTTRTTASARSRCCAPEDVHDARRVADALGIPHYTFDRRELFRREVVGPFRRRLPRGQDAEPLRALQPRREAAASCSALARPARRGVGRDRALRPHRPRQRRPVLDARTRSQQGPELLPAHGSAQRRSRDCVFPLGDATKAEVRAEAHDARATRRRARARARSSAS